MIDEAYDDLDELPAPPRREMLASDRQLLELAARAIGAVRVEDVDGENWLILHFADGTVMHGWNPLLFYSDTFELAVTLNIEPRFHLAGAVPGVSATCAADSRLPICREPWTPQANDKTTATCRVVVRAAAEIGDAMLMASPIRPE